MVRVADEDPPTGRVGSGTTGSGRGRTCRGEWRAARSIVVKGAGRSIQIAYVAAPTGMRFLAGADFGTATDTAAMPLS
jgi:hypothetical protein